MTSEQQPKKGTKMSQENQVTAQSQIQQLVLGAIKESESNGKLQSIIQEKVDSVLKGIVDDVLGWRSDFHKGLSEAIKAQVQVNFSDLNLSAYNALVMEVVQNTYLQAVEDSGIEKTKEVVKEIFGSDAPKKIKLSDMIKLMRKEHYGEEYEDHKMTLVVDDRRSLVFVSMDPDSDISEYSCKYKFTLTKDGDVYRVKSVDAKDKTAFSLGHEGKGSLLMVLTSSYIRGAEVEIDADEDHDQLYFRS